MTDNIEAIHAFWFGELDERGFCQADQNKVWFTADRATDEFCRSTFGQLLEQGVAGELDEWADHDRGLVALVVLLDQFSRNIHRGTPRAFAADDQAAALAQRAIAGERNLRLPLIHRVFLYLPLEHSEDLALQQQCVTLFQALEKEAQDRQFEGFTRYALAHRDVIEQFGRFPHRNEILGRASTAAELAYLDQHGGF